MKKTKSIVTLLALGAVAVTATPSHADPCGMVPPIRMIEQPTQQIALKRVGEQKTFISFKKGVMTMVLRPGFTGNVDEFGMLIPFPSPPALRKVDDNIFAHIAAAVDPPEVIAYVQRFQPRPASRSRMAKSAPAMDSDASGAELRYDEVRVVNREAVGMYDVAVLAAGSPKALRRWMKQQGFKYPDGMDDVVNDYVKDRWVFVAVKTQVGQKKGVNPRPGMKKVTKKRPPSIFTGHVQAMGFRYKTDKLVVPMRLSAFNEGELRNIVYLLTDSAKRIEGIPKRYVRRQISGKQLYKNLTGPLPVRVIGGSWKDLKPYQRQSLKTRRNPKAFNGIAKQLFAADMLALQEKRLSNPFEEEEKQLLKIGERLSLRGPQMDTMHGQILDKKRDRAVERSLKGIKNMTFTVIDGTFERETIAKENLKFANYSLPSRRNNKKSYDSRIMGPGGTPQGKLYRGASLELVDENGDRSADASGAIETPAREGHWGVGLGMLVLFLGASVTMRRRGAAIRRNATVLGVALAFTLAAAGTASAQSTDSLLRQLGDDKKAEAAVAKLIKKGKSAVDDLLDDIADTEDSKRRGWAIIALSGIGGKKADKGLMQIHNNSGISMLVRTWAAAARVEIAESTDDLFKLAHLARTFPAVQRPLGLRIGASLENLKGPKAAERLLKAQTQFPNLRTSLQASILKLSKKQLLHAMFTSDDNNVRRTAAAYIGTKASKDDSVGAMVARAYRFRKGADDVPWKGGALFLPGIKWSKTDSKKLVDGLVRWYLWAEINDRKDIKTQLHNNLRSIQLGRAAGYTSPGWNESGVDQWLRVWGGVIGKKKLRAILSQQGVRWKSRYRSVLNKL